MGVAIWHIEGYRGFEEYTDKTMNNVNLDLCFDAYFHKDEVVKMLNQHIFHKGYKIVKITEVTLKKIILLDK